MDDETRAYLERVMQRLETAREGVPLHDDRISVDTVITSFGEAVLRNLQRRTQ